MYNKQLGGTKLVELKTLPPTEKAANSHLKRAYLQVSTIEDIKDLYLVEFGLLRRH